MLLKHALHVTLKFYMRRLQLVPYKSHIIIEKFYIIAAAVTLHLIIYLVQYPHISIFPGDV